MGNNFNTNKKNQFLPNIIFLVTNIPPNKLNIIFLS